MRRTQHDSLPCRLLCPDLARLSHGRACISNGLGDAMTREHFLEQYERLRHVLPDLPSEEPARRVNPPLWAFWQALTGCKPETDLSEAHVVQALDMVHGEYAMWKGDDHA